MNKKGSMELSVNSIVILVIAIVMLGLILGFVRSKFSDVDKQLSIAEPDAPTATPSDPLTISRESITASANEKIALKIQVYNAHTASSPGTFSLECNNQVLTADTNKLQYSTKNIGTDSVEKFTLLAKIPSLAKDKYICTLKSQGTGPADTANPEVGTDVTKELLLTIV